MEERERDPDEPEVAADRVVLDHFNSDLHLQISKDGWETFFNLSLIYYFILVLAGILERR
jgi:hypothetical protein